MNSLYLSPSPGLSHGERRNAQMEESAKLDDVIRQNLKGLGYGE